MSKSKIETIVEKATDPLLPQEGSKGVGEVIVHLRGFAFREEYQFQTKTALLRATIKSMLGPLQREGVQSVEVSFCPYTTEMWTEIGAYVVHPTLGWVRYLYDEKSAGEIVFLN